MSKLQDFREQYPQYADLDDETLAQRMHERFYPDMDPGEYRDSIGLAPLPEPEKPPTFTQRVTDSIKGTAGQIRDPYTILAADVEDDGLEAFDIPDDPVDDAPSPLWRDQFFAGWDTYRANRAATGAVRDIEDLARVEDVARGAADPNRVGGVLGVSGQQLSNFARQQRANAGDQRAMFEIDTEIHENRMELVASLQEQIDRRAKLSHQAEQIPFSPATQGVVEAETFGQGFSSFADDPISVVMELSIRSAPNMADAFPLAIGGAMIGGPWGFGAGMGLGSSMSEYRASMVDGFLEAGVDVNNAEALIAAVENPELMAGIRQYATTRAGIIGAVDTISGGIASRNLTPFVKPAIARELSNLAAQTVVQSTLGATGEALAQVATGEELSPGEILAEGLGEGGTVVIDVAGATVTGVRSQRIQNQVARAEADLQEMLGRDVVEPEPDFSPIPETDIGEDGEVELVEPDPVPRGTPVAPTDIDPDPVPAPRPDPPVVFVDPRLKRQAFRDEMQQMADELVIGGGSTYIRDENDVIIGRSPSENPPWFKNMNQEPDYRMSVRQTRHAVTKAVTGKSLGVREQRVVGWMLNEYSGAREEQVDYARDQLEQARELRRQAFTEAGLEVDEQNDLAGEMFEESEYDADQNATSRVIYELMEQAEALGVDTERLALQYDEPVTLIGKLQESINAQRDQTGTQTGTPQQGTAAAARTPPRRDTDTGDLFGDDTAGRQAIADEEARRDVERNTGQDDLETGDPSDLFSQARFQRELEAELQNQAIGRDGRRVKVYRGEHGPPDPSRATQSRAGSVTFVDDEEVANLYATDPNDRNDQVHAPRVIPATLDIRNPVLNTPDDPFLDGDRLVEAIGFEAARDILIANEDQLVETGGWQENLAQFDNVQEALEADPANAQYMPLLAFLVLDDANAVAALKKAGYDGAIHAGYGESTEAVEYRVFDDSQISPQFGQVRSSRSPRPPVDQVTGERRGGQRGRGPDRRLDEERRVRLESMSRDEIMTALYTHELTGLANRRAFNEEQDLHPFLASVDADSLKFINDNLSHDTGDALLVAIGQALDQSDVASYHISGDEFFLGAETREELEAALELAQSILQVQTVSGPRGRVDGLNITWGIGKNKEMADAKMEAEKKAKQKRGERAPTGTAPKGLTMSVRNSKVLDMAPGTNYVPMIGQHGQLPIDPQNNFILGNGRAVRIPKQPVRREHILARMQQAFGVKIYQGRVKGPKTRLGFYRTGQGEIRIRNANDIEVAAHEVAHWIDDRNPWVRTLFEKFDEEIRSVSYDVSLDYEGYAEFMRLFFTQEPLAMERAPGFYDAWRKELKGHPKLEAMIYDIQELMHAWTFQGARQRLASKHANAEESFIDKIRRTYRDLNFYQSALDGLRSIKTAELDVSDGETHEAYTKFRLALGGTNGVLEAAMFFGTPGWRDDRQGIEFTGEPLMAVFGEYWGNDDLALFLIASRAQELKQQGRENLIRDDEMQAGLALGEQNPEFFDIHQRYQAWNDRMLDFAQGSGILGASTRAAIKEMNQSYVPFHRVIESLVEGKAVRPGGNPFMRLKGGTQNIANVWDNIVNNTGLIIRSAMMNDAKATLYKTLGNATNQKGGLYAAPIPKDVHPVSIRSEQVLKKIVESLGMTMKQYKMAKQGFASSDAELALVAMIDVMEDGLGEFVDFFKMGMDPTGDVDFYMQAGKKVWFEIADRDLWDSIKFMGPKPTNLALQVFGGFSATLRRGTVAMPNFQVKNFNRDTSNAWLLSSHIKVPAARALRVVFSKMHSDPAYQEMMVNGGGFANRIQGLQQHRKMIINPKRAVSAYDREMGRFENANRLAEYKAAREQGVSPRRSALASREISTDFAMRGSSNIARWLAISVPFMNAHAQGLYRIGRQLTARDLAISYAMRGGMLALASWALWSLNKDDERYEEMPEDQKDLNWVFFFGDGEDDVLLYPKPFENGMLFGTIPERILNYTQDRDGKEFVDAIRWIVLESFAMDPTPQLYQPLQDLLTNKTFTGAPIVPHYLDNVAPQEQYTYYTSVTARAAGKALGMSPVKLDHAIRGYFGTLGTYLLAASDAVIRHTAGDIDGGGDKPLRGETWRENIAVRALFDSAFAEGPPRRTKFTTDFYDMVRATEEVAATAALMQKRNNADVENYLEDPANQLLFALNPPLQQIKTKLSEVRQAMDLVRQDPEMAGEQKMVQLFELTRQRNEIARQAMAMVNEAQMEAENAQQAAP